MDCLCRLGLSLGWIAKPSIKPKQEWVYVQLRLIKFNMLRVNQYFEVENGFPNVWTNQLIREIILIIKGDNGSYHIRFVSGW